MGPAGMGSFDCARLRFAPLRMTGLVMDRRWTFSLGSGRVAPLQLEFVAARARLAERIPIRACDGACAYGVLRLRSLAFRSAQDDRVGGNSAVLWFMQKSRSFAALRMTGFVMGWEWNSCCFRLRRLFQFFEQSSILRQVF